MSTSGGLIGGEAGIGKSAVAGAAADWAAAQGLRDIATLLARPGEPVRASQLAGLVAPAGADPVLDDRARAADKARLTELDQDIDDATVRNDPERAAHLHAAVRTGTACTYQPAEPVDWNR